MCVDFCFAVGAAGGVGDGYFEGVEGGVAGGRVLVCNSHYMDMDEGGKKRGGKGGERT